MLHFQINYPEIEEDCLMKLVVSISDPDFSRDCNYYLRFKFELSKDDGGDIQDRNFLVATDLPHQFWIRPKGQGVLIILAFKMCPGGGVGGGGVLDTLPLEIVAAEREALGEWLDKVVEPGKEITKIRFYPVLIKDCNNFDAKVATVGVSAAGFFGGWQALTAVITGVGGVKLAVAGTLTAVGAGLALAGGVIIAIAAGFGIWHWLSEDCCELGVPDSDKGRQGSLAIP